jgi:hypothetical protein
MSITSYMKTGGACIKVTSNSNFHGAKGWIVPFTEDFQLTAPQKTLFPIQEFIKDMQSFVSDTAVSLGGSSAKSMLTTAQKMSNLLGVQLNNQYYYAQSWGGSGPTEFTITLNFNLGAKNRWNAKEEVFFPIMEVMGRTVPAKDGILITAPMPSGLGVFLTYGASLLEGTVGWIAQGVANEINKEVETTVSIGGKSSEDTKFSLMSRVWTVDFGWCNSDPTQFKSFFTVDNTIVTSSAMKLSPRIQMISGTPYPIAGSVTLSLHSQTTMLKEDFIKDAPR